MLKSIKGLLLWFANEYVAALLVCARLILLPVHVYARRHLTMYAAGDVSWTDAGLANLMRGLIDLDSGLIKLGLITSVTTPSKTAADPRWGAGGGTNWSTNQVTTAGTSYTGPITLASPSIAIATPDIFFRANVITLAQDASGFTNARWGIIFQDDANDYAIGFLDLGSDRSIVTGQLQIDWNGVNNDILKITNV